jgi:hypothetical protein
VLTVAAGLAARGLFDGAFAKVAGVVLYAVLIYELIVLIVPRMAVTTVAAAALAICWIIEFAQLTPGPAGLSGLHPVLGLVFGSTFSAWDLPAYTLGIFLAVVGDRLARSPRRRPVTS